MRKIAFMSVMLFVFAGVFAQEPLSFSEVVQADSATKDQIYFKLKEWVGTSFNSAKAVIEIDDKDAGLIIIRPVSDYSMRGLVYLGFQGHLRHTVKLQMRDGRFRVEITNFTHESLPGNCKDCSLGLITTDEQYPGRTALGAKGHMTKVWNDIKVKAKIISANYFSELPKIKFDSAVNNKEEDW